MNNPFDKPNSHRRRLVLGTLFVCVSVLAFRHALAAGDNMGQVHDQHQAQMSKETSTAFTRSEVVYKVPNVTMVRQDGAQVAFSKEMDDGRPVMML